MPRRAAVLCVLPLLLRLASGDGAPCESDYGPGAHLIEVDEPKELWDKTTNGHRQWILHVPPQRASAGPAPLVLVFHGASCNPYFMDKWLGLSEQVNKTGWVVIAPFGIAPKTNRTGAGACCDPDCDDACCESGQNLSSILEYQCGFKSEPGLQYGNDIAFTRYMVRWAAEHACVDADNVFATGHSNGAMFLNRLTCEASDLLRGAAPVAGNLLWPNCTPAAPVPFLEFCGTADYMCDIPFDKDGAPGNIAAWAARNGCDMSLPPVPSRMSANTNCTSYVGCAAGTELCMVDGMPHTWPGSAGRPAEDPPGTEVVFRRFANITRQPRPAPLPPTTPRPPGAPTPVPVVTPPPAPPFPPSPPATPAPPAPATPAPPSPPPPPPAGPRYHCNANKAQCQVKQSGHSSAEECIYSCSPSVKRPQFACDQQAHQCVVCEAGTPSCAYKTAGECLSDPHCSF